MSKKVKISKVEIEMGSETVKLTIDEAKRLKAALEELFGETVKVERHDHYHDRYPYIWYQRPGPMEVSPGFDKYRITCATNNTARLSLTDNASCAVR